MKSGQQLSRSDFIPDFLQIPFTIMPKNGTGSFKPGGI